MGLETGTYISDLNPANPLGSDAKSTADDHMRLIKSTIKATFPNIAGAVTVTHSDINTVTAKGNLAGQVWTGAHDYTGAAITVATPTLNTQAANKAYVDAQAFSGVLPGQASQGGKTVRTNGTAASWGFWGSDWAVKTTAYGAVAGDNLLCNTTAAGFTVTLSATPNDQDTIRIADYAGLFATNNLTIGRNGKTIMGSATDLVCDINNASFALVYVSASGDWRIV